MPYLSVWSSSSRRGLGPPILPLALVYKASRDALFYCLQVRILLVYVSYHQQRDAQLVPHRVDGRAEDQVFQPAVAMSAHHQQVGVDLLRTADDLAVRIG